MLTNVKQTRRMPAGDLVRTREQNQTQLNQDELNRVSGGAIDAFMYFASYQDVAIKQ